MNVPSPTERVRAPDEVSGDVAVALRGVRKVHGRGGSAVRALDIGDIDFHTGTFTAVMGVGAEYCVTSRDLGVFVDEAAESVSSDDRDVGVDGVR